jgi:outer membrane immunogenic protein
MRRGVTGITAAMALSVITLPAFAADVVSKPRAPPAAIAPVAPAYDWSGLYWGGHMGAGWTTNTWSVVSGSGNISNGTFIGKGTSSGALAGAQVGLNWQRNMTLFGLQADLSWADVHGTAANPVSPVPGNCWASPANQTASCGTRTVWLGNITARAGLLLTPHALFYVKAGVAFAHDVFTVTRLTAGGGGCVPPGPDYPGIGQTRTGWTAGIGAEKKFNPKVSGFLEYDYSDFGNKAVNFPEAGGNICSQAFTAAVSQTMQTVKLGLNWAM